MAVADTGLEWRVKSYPDQHISSENFELVSQPVPAIGDGEFLVKVTHLVVSPPLRMALGTGGISGARIPIGDVMRGTGQGRIVASNHAEYHPGDYVSGPFGWREYAVSDGRKKLPIQKVSPPDGLPITTRMHVMGAGGATAYFGLYDYAAPKAGDVVLVSAAAGTVGSLVCQLAKLSGCKVVGTAGNDEKCRWLAEDLGVHTAINYKTDDVDEVLAEACPGGIDVYFDNVGGTMLDSALGRIAQHGRVVLCGATSQYEGDDNWYAPRNYFNLVYRQASMHGFYVFNFQHRFKEAHDRLRSLIEEGHLTYREDVLAGIENLPAALVRVLNGENFGTQLVALGE